MKIKQLIDRLQEHNQDAQVVMAHDNGGNSFAHVDGCLGGDGITSIILFPVTDTLDSGYDDILDGRIY